jgi:hypothetical protein
MMMSHQKISKTFYIAVAKCKPKKRMAALRAAILFLGFAFVLTQDGSYI